MFSVYAAVERLAFLATSSLSALSALLLLKTSPNDILISCPGTFRALGAIFKIILLRLVSCQSDAVELYVETVAERLLR